MTITAKQLAYVGVWTLNIGLNLFVAEYQLNLSEYMRPNYIKVAAET